MKNLIPIKESLPTIKGKGYVIQTTEKKHYVAEYIGGAFLVGQVQYIRQIGWVSSDSREELVTAWKYFQQN